jgi:hypothetical protein
MFGCPFFQHMATYIQPTTTNLMIIVAAIGGAIGLSPIISDIRELSANNSFGNAVCAALASRGLTVYMKMLGWFDWTQCAIMLMTSGDVLANVHTETIYGKLYSVHLWNVSPEMVGWLRKNAHNRVHCVYHIHSFTTAPTSITWSQCAYDDDDYANANVDDNTDANNANAEDEKEPVPAGLPTTFFGKWVCGDKTFFFNKENVVMADFHAIVEMKQPLNIIGVNVTINGNDDDVVNLPIPLNFDCVHRLTLDVSPTNPIKCVADLPMPDHFGSPTHLYQMLCELYTQQLSENNWSDLRQTLTMLNKLKHNNYTYTINLTSLDLTSKHFTYKKQQLISGQ